MAVLVLFLKEAQMPKYIAKQSIGHFRPGDEIKGLEAKQLQALLASGAIEEYQEPEEPKGDGGNTDHAAKVVELEQSNADLVTNNTRLTTEKIASDQEVAELKTKVVELEKALSTAETALKKAQADLKKPAEK